MAVLLVSAVFFSGCAAGISQEDYDAAVSERDASQAQVASLEAKLTLAEDQIAALESDLAAAQGQITTLQSDFSAAQAFIEEVEWGIVLWERVARESRV